MIRRNFNVDLSIRQAVSEDKTSSVIGGYAAKFDSLSLDLGGFRERIAPGAFTSTLADKENDILALWSHDWSQPLGRVSAGTLTLTQDDIGLHIDITPDETTWCQNAVESVRSGNVKGMSFGFIVNSESWDYEAKVRTLLDVSLYEVSLTAFPAYPETEAAVRSIVQELEDSYTRHAPKPLTFTSLNSRTVEYLNRKINHA